MTHPEIISRFPRSCSIAERVVLINPVLFPRMAGESVHECRMFLLVVRGELTISKRDSSMTVHSNQFIDMLAWEPIKFESMSDDVEAWCLLPNYMFTNDALNGMKPADSESFKDRHSIPVLGLEPSETSVVITQLTLLRDILANDSHHYRVELSRSYFRNFMLEVGNIILHRQDNPNEIVAKIENRQDWIIRNFLKLVWRHYREEHNISFYARELNVSGKHLSRVIRENLGKTPYAVLRDELLQRAMFLLRDSKRPVQDIAADLHFSETAAFCKFFRKNTGLSPTAYRNNSRPILGEP